MAWTWFNLVEQVGHDYGHVATTVATSTLVVGFGLIARRSLSKSQDKVVPDSRPSVRGLSEMLIEFIAGISDMIIGPHGRHYIPVFASIFLFILMNNWIGLIPGMVPATENINATLAIGLFSFIFYNYQGFKENGVSYLKHFVGPVWWLFIIMVPIEIISNLVRPLSLGLRLANVMAGDHAVLAIFLELTKFGVPVIFYFLGMFVGFVQAFVFTMLSMVYVALATAHDH